MVAIANLLILFSALTGGHNTSSPVPKNKPSHPPQTDRNDRVKAFFEKTEKASESSRQRLLQSIDNVANSVRRGPYDPQAKRLLLEEIAKDRDAFETMGRLPCCDELLDVTIEYVESSEKIISSIDKFRDKQANLAIKTGDSIAFNNLDALDARLNRVLGGRENFTDGSSWSGSRMGPGGAFRWMLKVDSVAGGQFRGSLRQQDSQFAVTGSLQGNNISFITTEVLKGGKNRRGTRQFAVKGYLLSDRIVAEMGGVDVRGRAITGTRISLWRDGK